jgi:mannitol/fructose-specific phosphotransferase system IIA component (Ntr-type)
MRNLATLLSPSQIVDLSGRSPRAAVSELVTALPGPGAALQKLMLRSVMAREATMSTGLGNALAVPHARLEKLSRIYIALGRAKAGIDFKAPDGMKANLVVLIVTPSSQVNAYLQLLASVLWTFSDDALRRQILAAATPKDVLEALARRRGLQAT